MLVHGRRDGEVWYGAEVCEVEHAVVRRPVLAHQSRAVKAEHHGQVQQGDVVYHVVVCALHETGVDVAVGLQPLFGHAAGKRGRVPFGYAYVERAFGHGFHQLVHGATCGHGGRYAHDAGVLPCQFYQRFAEHVLI